KRHSEPCPRSQREQGHRAELSHSKERLRREVSSANPLSGQLPATGSSLASTPATFGLQTRCGAVRSLDGQDAALPAQQAHAEPLVASPYVDPGASSSGGSATRVCSTRSGRAKPVRGARE